MGDFDRKKIKKLLVLHAEILGFVLGGFAALRASFYFAGYYAENDSGLWFEVFFIGLFLGLILAVALVAIYLVTLVRLGLKFIPLSLVCLILTSVALVGSTALLQNITILNGYYHGSAKNADIDAIQKWLITYEQHALDTRWESREVFTLDEKNWPDFIKAMNPSYVYYAIHNDQRYVRIGYRFGPGLIFGLCVQEGSVPPWQYEQRRQINEHAFAWTSGS